MKSDPTYDPAEIQANPVWERAFRLSELENDYAPLGWSQYLERAEQQLKDPPCTACQHSYMGPANKELVCGHKGAGLLGTYARLASGSDGHCGPEKLRFAQHPLRNTNGSLK